jgi:urease accessory protein
MKIVAKGVAAVSFAVAVLAAGPAAAHHAMGGKTPSNLIEGLLSGLAHPIIGLDHLAFILAAGLVVGICRLHVATPLVFVGASMLGVALHLQGVDLPGAELVVGASVLLVGALIARGAAVATGAWLALFATAGLFHGYAYGEAVVGAELGPVWAYLLGLTIVQTAIATGLALVLQPRRMTASAPAPRLAGAAVALTGLAVLALQVV